MCVFFFTIFHGTFILSIIIWLLIFNLDSIVFYWRSKSFLVATCVILFNSYSWNNRWIDRIMVLGITIKDIRQQDIKSWGFRTLEPYLNCCCFSGFQVHYLPMVNPETGTKTLILKVPTIHCHNKRYIQAIIFIKKNNITRQRFLKKKLRAIHFCKKIRNAFS